MKTIITPTGAGMLPLLVYTITEDTGAAEATEAVAQLQRLADALDEWNARVPVLLEMLHEARDAVRDEDYRIAEENILRALALLAGDQ